LESALAETSRRRQKQIEHNEKHGITPMTIKKAVGDLAASIYGNQGEEQAYADGLLPRPVGVAEESASFKSPQQMQNQIIALERKMKQAASDLEFEEAMRIRDEIRKLEAMDLGLSAGSVTPRRLAAADSYARNADRLDVDNAQPARKSAQRMAKKSDDNKAVAKKIGKRQVVRKPKAQS
jgi:excinuclease ABC subunit B